MPDPSKKIEHEQLLAAYLDGELDQDQRAQVEALIVENAEYGDLLESWRNSGEALRALPRRKLDDQFAAKVLAAIDNQDPVNIHDSANTLNVDTQLGGESGTEWRIGLTAIVALAAMLLLVLFVVPSAVDFPITAMNDVAADAEAEDKDGEETIAGEAATADESGSAEERMSAMVVPAAPVDLSDQSKQPSLSEFSDSSTIFGSEDRKRKRGNSKAQATEVPSSRSQSLGKRGRGGELAKNGLARSLNKAPNKAPTQGMGFLQDGVASQSADAVQNSPARTSSQLKSLLPQPHSSSRPAAELAEGLARDKLALPISGQPGIDRVLVLNLNESRKTMGDIEKVLQANSIDFATRTAGKSDLSASRSGLALEALYIVSSKAKIKQATRDLSGQDIHVTMLSLPKGVLADQGGVSGVKPQTDRGLKNGHFSRQNIAAKKKASLPLDFAQELRPIQLDLKDKTNDLLELDSAATDQVVRVLLLISPQTSGALRGQSESDEASEKK